MRWLDVIMGKSKLKKPKIDQLFELPTAYITIQANLGLKSSGNAGICFKPVESSRFDETKEEIEELLSLSKSINFKIVQDKFDYLWAVLSDLGFEDLVATIHMISQTVIDKGFEEQLLCAIFEFIDKKKVYWIYNYKRGNFYPFVPFKSRKRDTSYEFRLKSVLEGELNLEKEIERWYPLWDIPFWR